MLQRESEFFKSLSVSKRGIVKIAASVLPGTSQGPAVTGIATKEPEKKKHVKNLEKALKGLTGQDVKVKSEKDFLDELRKESKIELKVAKTLRQAGIFKISGRDVYEDLETGDFWKISEDKQHVVRLFKEDDKGVADKRASKEAGKIKGPRIPDGTGPSDECPCKCKKDDEKEATIEKVSEGYETSAHFTADLDIISDILTTKKWDDWMKITDENYDTKCVEKNATLFKCFKELRDEIDKAK